MKNFSLLLVVLLLMLASFTAGVQYQRGDVNYDGKVSISDVTCLINYLLTDSWPEEPVTPTPQTETFTVNGVSFSMVAVEGGTYMLGASDDDTEAESWEKPAHRVALSSFSLSQTEVTQELWQAVMGSNPSWYSPSHDYEEDLQRPVECVSWEDCQTFITRLNELTGKNFRLPTEAEWEYAARGGSQSQNYKYAGSNTIGDVAWYDENSSSQTHPVATKAPNELGLYDMSGNVYEWCQDWYGSYSSDPQLDPTGPTSSSGIRVIRGGAWNYNVKQCRVTHRTLNYPVSKSPDLGLRLALSGIPGQEHHEYVDLGLPSGTLWATCNVGASNPEEVGDYFAWGETTPKETYTWSNYKWCNGSETTLTKYCNDSSYGVVDNKMELDPEDDAAYENWGSMWRMPTSEQQDELRQNCTWEWATVNGMGGYNIIGPNGASIFLPVAGYCLSMISHVGEIGIYWSRTVKSDNTTYARGIYFGSGYIDSHINYRSYGFTVRPVLAPWD